MALRIRLQRHGARHNPFYRMVVTESAHRRDGRFVEMLGYYNPKARGQDKELQLKIDRVDYWVGVGAKPSDTARSLIRRARRMPAEEPAAEKAAAPAPAAEETPVATEADSGEQQA